ncbi:DUF4232 domain-containing protein [Streptomyces sp. Ru72]|uniref:DUF4232 domain-containing protein n=1 Tax=Streptomyces sp. Ru72 TaxID=2080747 RepID=UPI000CDD65C0|nr:DUF4232 domain-containing protein [Streptomyces sp. Ru72]POX52102.1 hypothetical protein C3488_09690 [Streptomyces sp. Ru72]
MRVQQFRKVPAAAVVLAAGLALTACNGDDGKHSGVSSAPSATASTSGASQGSGSGTAGGGSSATATSGTGTGGTSSASGSATAPGSTAGSGTTAGSGSATASAGPRTTVKTAARCRIAHLTFAKGDAYGKGPYSNIPVRLTNSGPAPCSLHGFPGVDLVGKDGHVRARRSVEAPHTVVLTPGRSATFLLVVPQNYSGGSGVTFTRAVITLPREIHPHILRLRVNLPAKGEGPDDHTVIVGPVTR